MGYKELVGQRQPPVNKHGNWQLATDNAQLQWIIVYIICIYTHSYRQPLRTSNVFQMKKHILRTSGKSRLGCSKRITWNIKIKNPTHRTSTHACSLGEKWSDVLSGCPIEENSLEIKRDTHLHIHHWNPLESSFWKHALSHTFCSPHITYTPAVDGIATLHSPLLLVE